MHCSKPVQHDQLIHKKRAGSCPGTSGFRPFKLDSNWTVSTAQVGFPRVDSASRLSPDRPVYVTVQLKNTCVMDDGGVEAQLTGQQLYKNITASKWGRPLQHTQDLLLRSLWKPLAHQVNKNRKNTHTFQCRGKQINNNKKNSAWFWSGQ